jgi:membrane-associated phospholipid phosphatase
LALPVAAVVLLVAAARRGAVGRAWLLTSVASLAAAAAKDELKFVFGRPWPSTWLMWGTYEFHPFSNSAFFGGFPSGHTAYISAPLCVLWVLAPRWRWLWGGVIAVVMVGLVGANYHFVGDVLAGLLTGMGCAWGTLRLMRDVA